MASLFEPSSRELLLLRQCTTDNVCAGADSPTVDQLRPCKLGEEQHPGNPGRKEKPYTGAGGDPHVEQRPPPDSIDNFLHQQDPPEDDRVLPQDRGQSIPQASQRPVQGGSSPSSQGPSSAPAQRMHQATHRPHQAAHVGSQAQGHPQASLCPDQSDSGRAELCPGPPAQAQSSGPVGLEAQSAHHAPAAARSGSPGAALRLATVDPPLYPAATLASAVRSPHGPAGPGLEGGRGGGGRSGRRHLRRKGVPVSRSGTRSGECSVLKVWPSPRVACLQVCRRKLLHLH